LAAHKDFSEQGGETAAHLDAVWSTTGTASGQNRNGVDFTAINTTPLIKRATRRWISSGVLEFTSNNRTRSLDFGNGTCDRFGILALPNGDLYNIRLRR